MFIPASRTRVSGPRRARRPTPVNATGSIGIPAPAPAEHRRAVHRPASKPPSDGVRPRRSGTPPPRGRGGPIRPPRTPGRAAGRRGCGATSARHRRSWRSRRCGRRPSSSVDSEWHGRLSPDVQRRRPAGDGWSAAVSVSSTETVPVVVPSPSVAQLARHPSIDHPVGRPRDQSDRPPRADRGRGDRPAGLAAQQGGPDPPQVLVDGTVGLPARSRPLVGQPRGEGGEANRQLVPVPHRTDAQAEGHEHGLGVGQVLAVQPHVGQSGQALELQQPPTAGPGSSGSRRQRARRTGSGTTSPRRRARREVASGAPACARAPAAVPGTWAGIHGGEA